MAETDNKTRYLELAHFSLFAPCPGVENRNSRLAWCMSYNPTTEIIYPRVTVFLNNPSVTGAAGILYAPFDSATLLIVLKELEKVVLGPAGGKCKISNYTQLRENGVIVPNAEKVLQSELWFGKDTDGICWISVVMPDRPKIKFEFLLSAYHKITKSDGTEANKAEGSVLQALAVIEAVSEAYKRFTTAVKKPAVGGAAGGSRSTYTPKTAGASKEAKVPADDMFEEADIGF